jgi:N6-adenosine-specific RNA methylase IME4
MTLMITRTDDPALAEHAAVIRALGKRVVGDVIEIGRRLVECKRIAGHGGWGPWLQREFGWEETTALRFMRVFELQLKSGNLQDLDVPVSGLYLLAAPSTPDEARTEVIERAENGEHFTHAQVKEIIVARGEREILRKAQELRAAMTEERRAERLAKAVELSARTAPWPRDRKYPLLYADPPWRYDFSMTSTRAIEANYPTLPLEEICALPVSDLGAPTAVLFLWVPPAILEKGFAVIAAWGFTYCTGAVWRKDKIGAGFYFRQQHEHLLVATRGDMPAPPPLGRPPSILDAPRREHSRKPDEAYELIEGMYPELPKIELFARGPARPGWATWGNQAEPAATAEPAG